MSWAAVLFFLSEIRSLPSGLGRFADLNDKVVHALLYSTLGITLAWARRLSPWKPRHSLILLAGYAYGAMDEWHQSLVPGRNPDVMDFLADVVGVTIGYLLFHAMWAIFIGKRPDPVFANDPEPAISERPDIQPGTPAKDPSDPREDSPDRHRRHTRHGS